MSRKPRFAILCRGGFFNSAANSRDGDLFRSYFKQVREEVGVRLAEKLFCADGTPNKMWVPFAKKKLLNKEL